MGTSVRLWSKYTLCIETCVDGWGGVARRLVEAQEEYSILLPNYLFCLPYQTQADLMCLDHLLLKHLPKLFYHLHNLRVNIDWCVLTCSVSFVCCGKHLYRI